MLKFLIILVQLSVNSVVFGVPIIRSDPLETAGNAVINQMQKGETNIRLTIKNAIFTLPAPSKNNEDLDKWVSNLLTSYMQGNQDIPVFFNQNITTKLTETDGDVNQHLDSSNNNGNLEFSSDVDIDREEQSGKTMTSTETAPSIKEEI